MDDGRRCTGQFREQWNVDLDEIGNECSCARRYALTEARQKRPDGLAVALRSLRQILSPARKPGKSIDRWIPPPAGVQRSDRLEDEIGLIRRASLQGITDRALTQVFEQEDDASGVRVTVIQPWSRDAYVGNDLLVEEQLPSGAFVPVLSTCFIAHRRLLIVRDALPERHGELRHEGGREFSWP